MVDWEKCYQDGVTPWDYGRPAPPLLDWIRGNRIEGRVLVPGCGTGHDAAVLARAFPAAEVVGLDISESAVARARAAHRDVSNLVFRIGDLFDAGAVPDESFDWIFEHTCFCAIDPVRRGDYVRAVARILRPGGRLLAVFYLDPYDDEHQPGGGPPHGAPVEELDRWFGERFAVGDSFVPTSSFPGREGRELLRLMTRK